MMALADVCDGTVQPVQPLPHQRPEVGHQKGLLFQGVVQPVQPVQPFWTFTQKLFWRTLTRFLKETKKGRTGWTGWTRV